MKNIGFIYSSDHGFEELIAASQLSPKKEHLVRIHTCIHNIRNIRPFINKILSCLPNAKIIGSSTSGVIFDGELFNDRCVISITEFENAFVETSVSMLSDGSGKDISGRSAADKIADKLLNDNPNKSKLLLAFAARPFLGADEFAQQLNFCTPNLHIIGGVANTVSVPLINVNFSDSFVFNENGVYQNSIVCAAISSDNMHIYTDAVYEAQPVGQKHTITAVDGHIVKAIDYTDAVKWYEDTLGINFSDFDDPNSIMTHFPLVNPEQSSLPQPIFYSSQNETDMLFFDENTPVMYSLDGFNEGDTVRIAYSSVENTVSAYEKVCKSIEDHPAEVLFGYISVSKLNMFGKSGEWHLLPFKNTGLCGAVVTGEFANINNINRYCELSLTVAALAENECRIKLNVDEISKNARILTNSYEDIIDYLLKYNKPDDEIFNDKLIPSGLYEYSVTGTIPKYLIDLNSGKFDKICMISIKNESLIKAFMNENDFSEYFEKFNSCIISFIGSKHYNYYIYKETILIITANEHITGESFSTKMRSVQELLLDFRFQTYVPVCEFAVVINEENMIKKAELTLNTMRNAHSCFQIYTPELGLEQHNSHKMNMISIINNAISNNLVIPYFQGIRDNSMGGINMYESLMRLSDTSGNIYTPYHFMDIAKEYGYYADISTIMISKVLNLFRGKNKNVTINMNISDVYNDMTVKFIFDFMKNAPHPENFIFELTETEEIVDYQVILEFAKKIHSLGGKIAIDDFGSGFSNIVHVFKIPADYIKIDGEIIKHVTSDAYAREFLEMISEWSKKHSKEIIAEFVENDSIQHIVEHHGIRFSQGYLYSKPSKLF